MIGPGTAIKLLLSYCCDIRPTPACPCEARAKEMNDRGWMWAWRERRMVMSWVAEEAGRIGHTRATATWLGLLGVLCIERARAVQERGRSEAD